MLHAVDSKELVFLGGFFAGDRPEEDGNAPTHAGAVKLPVGKTVLVSGRIEACFDGATEPRRASVSPQLGETKLTTT